MSKHPYFPLFVDLSEKRVLVVGAGRIGARRAAVLAQFCDHVTVIAPQARPEIEALAASGTLTLWRRPYAPGDLEGVDLALAATDDAALNAAIAADCRVKGIPVNDAGDKSLCDFYFPGIAMGGGVVAGVTASGEDHRLARRAAERLRECLNSDDE